MDECDEYNEAEAYEDSERASDDSDVDAAIARALAEDETSSSGDVAAHAALTAGGTAVNASGGGTFSFVKQTLQSAWQSFTSTISSQPSAEDDAMEEEDGDEGATAAAAAASRIVKLRVTHRGSSGAAASLQRGVTTRRRSAARQSSDAPPPSHRDVHAAVRAAPLRHGAKPAPRPQSRLPSFFSRPLPAYMRRPLRPPSCIPCGVYGIQRWQLEQHIRLMWSGRLHALLSPVLNMMMYHKHNVGGIFNVPVDPAAHFCSNYFNIVEKPMDLSLVRYKLEHAHYSQCHFPSGGAADDGASAAGGGGVAPSGPRWPEMRDAIAAFTADVRLVFKNAMLFNPPLHSVHVAAYTLLSIFDAEVGRYERKAMLASQRLNAHACALCNGHTCGFCSEKCLRLEPPVVTCSGQCHQRVRQNGAYFTLAAEKQSAKTRRQGEHDAKGRVYTKAWCLKCVGRAKLAPGERKHLVKHRNDFVVAEPWVRCFGCKVWYHQICAMYNGPQFSAARRVENGREMPIGTLRRALQPALQIGPQSLDAAEKVETAANVDAAAAAAAMSAKIGGGGRRPPPLDIASPAASPRGGAAAASSPSAAQSPLRAPIHTPLPAEGARDGYRSMPSAENSLFLCPSCCCDGTLGPPFRIHTSSDRTGAAEMYRRASEKVGGGGGPGSRTGGGSSSCSSGAFRSAPSLPGGDEVAVGEERRDGATPVNPPAFKAHLCQLQLASVAAPASLATSAGNGIDATFAAGFFSKRRGARDLARCGLTDYLEERIALRIRKTVASATPAQRAALIPPPTAPLDSDRVTSALDAIVASLTLRVVSVTDHDADVPPVLAELKKTMQEEGVAGSESWMPRGGTSESGKKFEQVTKIPYRQRALMLFQAINGCDVLIFCAYIQEYGWCDDGTVPMSNQRTVNIAYIDSISFFEPRWLRTPVYHEILVGYLAKVKERGFVCAHIWACPPTRGSDYIFHRHPREQKVPGWERLQRWYEEMLQQALTEGTVVEVSNLYRDHFERFVPAHLAAQSVRLPGRLLKLKPQAVAGGDSAAAFAPPTSAAAAAKVPGAADASGGAGRGRRSSRQPKKTKKFGEESAATAMVVSAEDRKARQRAAAKRKALADFPPSLALGSLASSVLPVGPAPLLPGHFWIQQLDDIMKKKKKKKGGAPSLSHAASGSGQGSVGGGFARSPNASVSEGSGSESGKKRRRERTAAERIALRLQIDDSHPYQEKKKQRKSKASTRKSGKAVPEPPTSTVAKLAALIAPMRVRLLVARLQPLDPRTGRYVIPATGALGAQQLGVVKREAPPTAASSAAEPSAPSSCGASSVKYNDHEVGATSRIADERGHFLQFCMENHLQFDTLRRAKHSTSLVLHMLHNPQHAVVPEKLVAEAQAARARAEALPIPEGGAAAPPPVPQPRAFDVVTAHAPELVYSAGAMAQAIALIRTRREAASSATDQASDDAAAAASAPHGLSSLATATASS